MAEGNYKVGKHSTQDIKCITYVTYMIIQVRNIQNMKIVELKI